MTELWNDDRALADLRAFTERMRQVEVHPEVKARSRMLHGFSLMAEQTKPCKWWQRWFCKAPVSPLGLDWSCTVCHRLPTFTQFNKDRPNRDTIIR